MYPSAIAWEGRSLFDGAPIAVVVSNIGNVYSKNPKCGKYMAQATILRTDMHPQDADPHRQGLQHLRRLQAPRARRPQQPRRAGQHTQLLRGAQGDYLGLPRGQERLLPAAGPASHQRADPRPCCSTWNARCAADRELRRSSRRSDLGLEGPRQRGEDRHRLHAPVETAATRR